MRRAPRIRVLLVDDAEASVALVERTLSAHGYEVSTTRVKDVAALEAALAGDAFDLCISDDALASLDAMATLAAEARTSERRFQSLIAAMEDVVFSVDADLRYTGVYGRGTELGFRPGLVIGKRPDEVLPEALSTLHESAYAKALSGEHVVFDWVFARPTGTRHYQTSVSPLRDDSGEVSSLVGVTREITRQKEMQEQLLLSERLAIVGSMTASLTHELNNPLTSLLLNLEVLVGQSTQIPEPLADAWAAARRLLDIITDVKLISRAADDRNGSVDICALLDSTARLAAPQLRHRATLLKEYPRTRVEVQGNESRLGQVFLNLILNAAQAIPEGKADRNTVRLVVNADAISTTVAVIDTGVGMPREILARLFTPFFTTKPAGIGSGIGLSISKRIIDSVGGRIEVESTVGQGTTFRVIFPRVSPAEDAAP